MKLSLINSKKGLIFLIVFLFILLIFFYRFIIFGKIPIPSDTIIGMYHPWRDVVWDGFLSGVPFKNFLITDPVRQQFPWRFLAIEAFKNKKLPLWNPYNFSGTPLLANFQSAPFSPFNILFFLFNFPLAWGISILLQPLLAGIFTFLYLRQVGVNRYGCLFGALTFSFCGFSIAWMEWGTVVCAALWLPLILLSIEKIFFKKDIVPDKYLFFWSTVFILSLGFCFFAGHLQIFFYVFLFSFIYLVWRSRQFKENHPQLFLLFVICYLLFAIITSIQWLPAYQFIKLSSRELDQSDWQKQGWFIPWQNLVQFLVPDFFGNPATLNYWGVWNYAEHIGYVGIIPLILATFAIFGRPKKIIGFFTALVFLSLAFALPTPLAKTLYQWRIPLISTSQPTRLLVLTDFSLSVLAAFGFQLISKKRNFSPLFLFFMLYGVMWTFVLAAPHIWPGASWIVNLPIAKRNLILPTGILACAMFLMMFLYRRQSLLVKASVQFLLLSLVVFDLVRFGWKFTPFNKKEWIFPSTETIEFLKKDKEVFRFMSNDRRIFPPNFSAFYKLQTVDGYDPLFLLSYAELIAASERGEPNISGPLGFNRIITPQNYDSSIINLLNVKYVLSLKELNHPKLKLVFEEGQTKTYENINYYPRVFLVDSAIIARDKKEAINKMFDSKVNLRKQAIIFDNIKLDYLPLAESESAELKRYSENEIEIVARCSTDRLLILADNYYPTWDVYIDGVKSKVYQVDYSLRGVLIPEGNHRIFFRSRLF